MSAELLLAIAAMCGVAGLIVISPVFRDDTFRHRPPADRNQNDDDDDDDDDGRLGPPEEQI